MLAILFDRCKYPIKVACHKPFLVKFEYSKSNPVHDFLPFNKENIPDSNSHFKWESDREDGHKPLRAVHGRFKLLSEQMLVELRKVLLGEAQVNVEGLGKARHTMLVHVHHVIIPHQSQQRKESIFLVHVCKVDPCDVTHSLDIADFLMFYGEGFEHSKEGFLPFPEPIFEVDMMSERSGNVFKDRYYVFFGPVLFDQTFKVLAFVAIVVLVGLSQSDPSQPSDGIWDPFPAPLLNLVIFLVWKPLNHFLPFEYPCI